jgi:hypothetical protein
MAGEKPFMHWPADPKGIPAPVASQAACTHSPSSTSRRLFTTLARFTLLSVFFFTIYIWSGGKFDRFTGGEEDLWLVDAFVRHDGNHGNQDRPLRGKAAEKLYL